MDKHLLFYDGTCGLCDHIVQWLLSRDHKARFLFAPLQGKTAADQLTPALKKGDTLVLIEHFRSTTGHPPRIFTSGKGALRILWLLGGVFALVGCLSFLPGICFDWPYRFVAARRHHFFAKRCILPSPLFADRFLS